MISLAIYLTFTATCFVALASDGGVQVSLYEVGPHDEEIKNELTGGQLITRNLSCFDRETVDLIAQQENTFDFSTSQNERPDEQGFMNTSEKRSNSTVDLPLKLNLKFSESSQPTESIALYHLRHLATIARILNDVEIRREGLDYQAAYPASDVTFREDEVDVIQLPVSSVAGEPSGMQLKRVPTYCKALLSDNECLQNAVRSTLPHSLDQIRACVDVLFQNLVKYHSFFRLPSSRLNVTRLANSCVQDSLKRFSERTVKCFHGSAASNKTALDSSVQKYQSDPYKKFSFDFNQTVDALRSASSARYSSSIDFWFWFFSTLLFHFMNRAT